MIKTNDSDTVPKNLELVYSGKDYFARLEAIIRDAQFEIHLQMYLFENDATGKRIVAALKEAALRKVDIYATNQRNFCISNNNFTMQSPSKIKGIR